MLTNQSPRYECPLSEDGLTPLHVDQEECVLDLMEVPKNPLRLVGLRQINHNQLSQVWELRWPLGYFDTVHNRYVDGGYVAVEPYLRIGHVWSFSDVGQR